MRFVAWSSPEDLRAKLLEVLADELKLENDTDVRGFNRALGAKSVDEYDYFNASRGATVGSVEKLESWQVLSPLRGLAFGVGSINRDIHERFRPGYLELARRQWPPIPKPLGAERIVYGDKLINLNNHRRDGRRVYPQDGALGYLANGEIGIAVGQWKTGGNPKILKVEFASQPGYTYDFYANDFRDEGDPALELAYALTIHKAQGSQFRLVILILPEAHPILSRELVYTAITRHQERIVIMYQAHQSALKELAAPHRSETARRKSNLMRPSRMVEIPLPKGSVFLQEGLVHRTSKGVAVRSKSELVIAEALSHAKIEWEYEKALNLGESIRYPDFTIEDDVSGRTVYWEHLGLLNREDYRRAWQSKLSLYRANGILPAEEGGGEKGWLITSTESSTGGFDVALVNGLINRYLTDS